MRILVIAAYFDWFSGYQETAIARALADYAEVTVIAGDRVSPIFSDQHLERLQVERKYRLLEGGQHGVRVIRVPAHEIRSMIWNWRAVRLIARQQCDLIIQSSPGQLLPLAANLARHPAPKVALYGDNHAMWTGLNTHMQTLKRLVFNVTKGCVYRTINHRARAVFGFTPNTQLRLARYAPGHQIRLLPLPFQRADFFFDAELRRRARATLNIPSGETLIIFAGKFQPQKRIESLIDGFSAASQTIPDISLLLVGVDASKTAEYIRTRISQEPGLSDRIILRQFVDTSALNTYFNAADIGVWPAMPAITIQQAMGTGLQVVVPANDLVSHLIRPGSGCCLAPQLGLAQSIETAIVNLAAEGPPEDGKRESVAAQNEWLSADAVAKRIINESGVLKRKSGREL